MEAAASIGGLVSLTANVVQGVKQLHVFCENFKSANQTVTNALVSLEALADVIGEIQSLLRTLTFSNSALIRKLGKVIQQCETDVSKWLVELKRFRTESKTGWRKWSLRPKIAVSQKGFPKLDSQVVFRVGQLNVFLSILCCDLDRRTLRRLEIVRPAIPELRSSLYEAPLTTRDLVLSSASKPRPVLGYSDLDHIRQQESSQVSSPRIPKRSIIALRNWSSVPILSCHEVPTTETE